MKSKNEEKSKKPESIKLSEGSRTPFADGIAEGEGEKREGIGKESLLSAIGKFYENEQKKRKGRKR